MFLVWFVCVHALDPRTFLISSYSRTNTKGMLSCHPKQQLGPHTQAAVLRRRACLAVFVSSMCFMGSASLCHTCLFTFVVTATDWRSHL
jgi:hypothetical protein